MRLSRTVDPEDVTEAIRLIREAMLSYAIDPLTGKIDMDMITTGKSSALRERQAELKRQVKSMVQNKGHTSIEFNTLLAEMSAQSSIVHTMLLLTCLVCEREMASRCRRGAGGGRVLPYYWKYPTWCCNTPSYCAVNHVRFDRVIFIIKLHFYLAHSDYSIHHPFA
jgi:hypothetical protein